MSIRVEPEHSPRILLVGGPSVGGIRRHLDTVMAELPARGFEVAFAGPAGVRLTAEGQRFDVEMGDRPRPRRDLRSLVRLREVAREWKPDLVHAQGVKAALLSLLAFPGGRPPVVVTFQNMWHGGPLNGLLRLLARRARSGIAVSEAVRQSLRMHRIELRAVHVITNSVDLDAFYPAPDRPDRPFTATFLGRLTEEKGILVLLAAVPHLVSTGLRIPVAGDGPVRPQVEAEAARAGSPITYLGHKGDVLPLYHSADVVLMPSYSEGLPLTALEAMACAIPVIATRVGGLPEAVVDGVTGTLVPPGDPRALAAAIEAMRADPQAARAMGQAGRRRVEAEFGQERILERIVSVYREVLQRE